jgi:hypothetical protein
VGIVTRIYINYELDANDKPTNKPTPESEWQVRMTPETLPDRWCYPGVNSFAPTVADLTLVEKKNLKVYGWGGEWRNPRNYSPTWQARFVMAAPSMAAVKRYVGVSLLWNMCETGNSIELECALTNPGKLLVSPDHSRSNPTYYVVDPEDSEVRP